MQYESFCLRAKWHNFVTLTSEIPEIIEQIEHEDNWLMCGDPHKSHSPSRNMKLQSRHHTAAKCVGRDNCPDKSSCHDKNQMWGFFCCRAAPKQKHPLGGQQAKGAAWGLFPCRAAPKQKRPLGGAFTTAGDAAAFCKRPGSALDDHGRRHALGLFSSRVHIRSDRQRHAHATFDKGLRLPE